ncbi:MAG: hypothetical protein EBS38_07955, partial [Actinobacteria bacterium]|nr:hypothetical protein [Actinomycetota bacterium]
TAQGGNIVHGPAAFSEQFPGAQGQTLSFWWRAVGGADNYHVYAALLRTDPGLQDSQRWTQIIYQTGSSTNWAQSNVTIPAAGTYRFVFVSGTQDFSCGRAAGASLYIDNVQVLSSSVPQAVAAYVARKIAYRNTSDAPVASRTATITGVNELNETANASITINITPVDDNATAESTTSFFVNTAASDSFAVRAGSITATDVDGDALTLDIVSGSPGAYTHSGVTYDKRITGQFGDFWVDQQSLRWLIVPNNAAMDGVQTLVTENFPVRVISSGTVDPDIDVTVSARISYDMKAGPPGILAIYSIVSATQNEITYEVEFDEFVDDFAINDITMTGTSGGTGWVLSAPQLVLGTTKYRFVASNPNAVNGTVDFTLATSSIRDFAFPPNNLSSGTPSATDSSLVTISKLPGFDVGPSSSLAASGSADFALNSWGSGISGIQISITNPQPGDELVFSNQNGVTGTFTASKSVLLLEGATNLADTVWETAVRSITFSTSNNAPVARNFEYHLRPIAGYDFESGAMFLAKARANTNFTQAQTLAAQESLYGLQGYLATPTTPSQQLAAARASALAGHSSNWLGIIEDSQQTGGYTWSNSIPRDMALSLAGFNAWQSGEPNSNLETHIQNWNQTHTNAFGTFTWTWNDSTPSSGMAGYLVEFGLRGSEDLPSLLRKTQSHTVDLVAPSVVKVFGVSDNYGRGENIDLSVQFSEAVTVGGSPVSRLEILPGKFAQYVSGSGTNTLVYRYVLEAGVTSSDLAYVSTSSLQLQSHTIRDFAGNNAVLTLPSPGALGSLNYESNVVLQGDILKITLTGVGTQSAQANVQFRLTSAVAMVCSSLSSTDFSYTNLSSSSLVVTPAGNSTSCTISISHTIPKASFGSVRLAPTASFEVTLADATTYSSVIVGNNSILVTMAPDPGKGEVIVDESNLTRQRPTSL